uniref:Uncharacterized protein n=1 Tax=Ditylenchus dipsaci TaxID=166011 RepID=A0A915D7E4_9BILA
MDSYYAERGNLLGFCNGYSMSFRRARLRDSSRARNPMQRVTGGIKSQKAMYSASQIKQLTANYTRRADGSRMEFLVSIAAHLERYQGH